MQRKSVAVVTAAFLAGGSTVALAQMGSGGTQGGQGYQGQGANQNLYNRSWIPGPVEPAAPNQGTNPNPSSRMWAPGPLAPSAQSMSGQGQVDSQTRFNQRAALRQELRRVGFQNIRILDTAYLVQASTPDGRPVMMVLSPTDQGSANMTSSVGSDRAVSGQRQASQNQMNQGQASQRRQQFGASQDVGPTVDLSELAARMEEPGLVEKGQVRSYLQSRGFTNVSDLSQNGNIYSGTANWYGEQVNLRVDGRNGFVIEPSHMNQNQLRNMLSRNGFDSINNIQQQGTSYRVQASRDGSPMNLWVDARTGEINRQTASN